MEGATGCAHSSKYGKWQGTCASVESSIFSESAFCWSSLFLKMLIAIVEAGSLLKCGRRTVWSKALRRTHNKRVIGHDAANCIFQFVLVQGSVIALQPPSNPLHKEVACGRCSKAELFVSVFTTFQFHIVNAHTLIECALQRRKVKILSDLR